MRRSLRSWLWRVPIEEEVSEELDLHVELRVRDLVARGIDPQEAREMSVSRLGERDRVARACVEIARRRDFEMWLTHVIEDLRDDVKVALRQLWRARGFATTAVLTLALGIGANAAVFGVLKSVLLDALPYEDAGHLVRVFGRRHDGSQPRAPLSAGTVVEIASRHASFDGMTSYIDRPAEAVHHDGVSARVVQLAWVDADFFDVLRVEAAEGRTFRPDETSSGLVPLSGGELGEDSASVVVLTNSGWQRQFGGTTSVVGRSVRINGVTRTIVGVLPPGFVGPMGDADFYLAFDLAPVVAHPMLGRGSHWLGVIGRLKPGATAESANADMSRIGDALAREFARENGSGTLWALPLRDSLVGASRTTLLVLMASAAFVLVIACANLAGGMLSRVITRRKEFAVRAALGAGRGRLLRQLLTETSVLGVLAGAAGLLVGITILHGLRDLAVQALPAYAELSIDTGTVLVTMAVGFACGIGLGLTPAIVAARRDLHGTLRDESFTATEGQRARRIRHGLVAAQLALCVSLLVGAGLLGRSLWAMTSAPFGFEPGPVMTAAVQLAPSDYATPEARAQVYELLTERLKGLPGVIAVASSISVPTIVRQRVGVVPEGTPLAPGAPPLAAFSIVSDDYFRALRIPLKQGRTFDARDRMDGVQVVVVSESLAKRHWPAGGAVGARMRLGSSQSLRFMEVIGIVGDVRNDLTRADAEPMVYRPARQVPAPVSMTFFVRSQQSPLGLTEPIARELGALDRNLAAGRFATLAMLVGEGLSARRLPAVFMSGFGILALVLASVGVYAMFSAMTTARQREFGVRLALGSPKTSIAALVIRQSAGWMAAGLAAGALGVLGVVGLIRDLLFDVTPFDVATLAGSVLIVLMFATFALMVPVRRAIRVDPAVILRSQ